MLHLPLGRFKSAILRGDQVQSDTLIRKDVVTTVEDMDDRKVRFTISTAAIDREGDLVAVDGWVLDAYRLNPVVLWGHDARELPIGRCIELGNDGVALKATVEFVPADMPCCGPRAEAVLRMCRTGFLSATSVGFRPLEYEMAKERMTEDDWFPPLNFLRNELLEFSVVTIPCNQEALIEPGERRELVTPPPPPPATPQEMAAEAEQAALMATAQRARQARQRRAQMIEFA
jgi:HK97 family phage prohead protease